MIKPRFDTSGACQPLITYSPISFVAQGNLRKGGRLGMFLVKQVNGTSVGNITIHSKIQT
ncbi:MAG: hypothetical protein KAT76_07045 [Bacteroidales bacterium]|nr:hypothetical protein [Bacteroidales bacterium]